MDDFLSNLTVVCYQPHLAEYAWEVRSTLLEKADENYIIAVDLPQGLENEVLSAVKDLPKLSLITDSLNRTIPIIPTSAPIEAVRSYLDFGHDLVFLDTCFPVSCSLEEWNQFQNEVNKWGIDHVIENAEEIGIDLKKIIGVKKQESKTHRNCSFIDTPEVCTLQKPFESTEDLEYLSVRRQIMAMRLLSLLKLGKPVIFVCHHMHCSEVTRLLTYDNREITTCPITLPTKICKVREGDIPLITDEIPYHMYLYELFRDTPVNRQDWIERICVEVDEHEDVETIQNIVRFSKKISLIRGRRNPDLSSILTASECCTDEIYTQKLKEVALSYPPADKDSNTPVNLHLDYNFQALTEPDTQKPSVNIPWEKMRWEKMQIMQRYKLPHNFIYRFPESIRNELKARKYFSGKYRFFSQGDSNSAMPFFSGIGEGVDVRETLRDIHSHQIYVQQPEIINNASYVFDFGGEPTGCVYYFKRRALLGLSKKEESPYWNHYIFTHVALFAQSKKTINWWMDDLDYHSPLPSTLKVALDHSDMVYLFSDSSQEIPVDKKYRSKVHRIPLRRIPVPIQLWVKEFYAEK